MILTARDGLEVVKHGLYDDANPRMGRFIDLTDGTQTFRYSVHRDIENLPAPGDSIYVELEARRAPKARKDRNGDAFVAWETKYRMVAFEPNGVAKAA